MGSDNDFHSSFLNLEIANFLRTVDVGAHGTKWKSSRRKRGNDMRKWRRLRTMMLAVVLMVVHLVTPVMAKDLPEGFSYPKLDPDTDLKVEIVGVYTAWNEELPVGLRTSRSNILGTDRKVMSGKYVDCVVAIDLPSDEEFYSLQVYLATDSASNQLTARVDAKRDFASSEVISAYTIADLQLDDDIWSLTANAPNQNNDHRWTCVSYPYLRTDAMEGSIRNWGQLFGKADNPAAVHTEIVCDNFELDDCKHLEVTFRLYAVSGELWEDYWRSPDLHPTSNPDLGEEVLDSDRLIDGTDDGRTN